MSVQEWCISSGNLRGQVKVSEAAGDGAEGPCLRGIGEVPRPKLQWRKARVMPSRGSDGNAGG